MNAEMMVIDAREDERAWTMRVYLDGEDVTNATYRAMMPIEPSVEAEGWVDRYMLVDGVIQFNPKEKQIPEIPRTHGMIRWESK